MRLRFTLLSALLCLGTALFSPVVRADALRSVQAVRGTPVIDGALEDGVWALAPFTGPFLQRDPALGAPGSLGVRARFLYDDDALYLAVQCETHGRAQARLGRRDVLPPGEYVRLLIDARGEGNGALAFATNPAGMQADSMIQAGGGADDGWDAIWEVAVQSQPDRWQAEFRIPWNVLRFDGDHPQIRVQIERYDFAHGELTALVPIATDAPRYVAGFAPLHGIHGLKSSTPWELRPYTLGRLRLREDPDRLDPTGRLTGSVGTDAKLGLTHDLTLDATINPDFGQVEVDPAVLNLTTYETFFPEKRAFFLEGSDLFSTPLTIVHTRRIGQAVSPPSEEHSGGKITAVDPNTTIYGASKITGRIGPISVGVLEAMTAPAGATERWTDAYGVEQKERRVLAPTTNWLATRLRGPLGQGSTAGATFTHVDRFGKPNDAVGAVDWDWRSKTGRYRFNGQMASSWAWNTDDGQHNGRALYTQLSRTEDPVWVWNLRLKAYSHQFDPNGLGYLDRPDLVQLLYDTTVRTPRPNGPVRRASFNPWFWRTVNTEGLVIDQGAGLELGLISANQWNVFLGGRYITGRYDDRETRGEGPLWMDPGGEVWMWIDSDPRTPLRGGIWEGAATQNGGYRANGGIWLGWIPQSNVTLSLSTGARMVFNVPRWVSNDTDAQGQTHVVFGQQTARIYDTTLRAGVAFSRRATLDLYSQLLVGQVHYRDYRELLDPRHYGPYQPESSQSYDQVAFTVNAVGRYEYQPGSYVTLVLLHRESLDVSPTEPGFGQGAGLLNYGRADTMVMTKLTYLIF